MGAESHRGHDVRPPDFFERVPKSKRILELGSCQGGGTFQLARHPGVNEVVAIEGRRKNIEKALVAQQAQHITNVKFIEANLETFDFSSLGRFDAVYCVGLLYHLPQPWNLLGKLESVADALYINTHYCPTRDATMTMNGYEGTRYSEYGMSDPLSGLSSWSFWPTLKSLSRMLIDCGFIPEVVDTDSTGFCQCPHGTTIVARPTPIVPSAERERLLARSHDVLERLPADAGSRLCAAPKTRLDRVMTDLKWLGRRLWLRVA